jgi:hypothetical protein
MGILVDSLTRKARFVACAEQAASQSEVMK